MDEHQASIEVADVVEVQSGHGKLPFPYPPKDDCLRCNNLIENPSFETGLAGWMSENTFPANDPFEGTHTAGFGPGVASLYQDVSLEGLEQSPLFLSFEVLPKIDFAVPDDFAGNFVVRVLWLDKERNPNGIGLRLSIIQDEDTDANTRLTYFDITDVPPKDAAWARLQFSKGVGRSEANSIELDQVILTPISSINLVQNPSFELGITGWSSNNFNVNYTERFEGIAEAFTEGLGTLSQDVRIGQLPDNSSFLLSFAAFSDQMPELRVTVGWFGPNNDFLGSGLELTIPNGTLANQNNYLSYLDITSSAPDDTVIARITFTAPISAQRIAIDKVIFARVKTPNLVQNPSFEQGQEPWNFDNTTVVDTNEAYEGQSVARIPFEGGMLFQDVSLKNAEGHCYLFNFGFRNNLAQACDTLAEVRWLDRRGIEIGLGLSIVIPRGAAGTDLHWLVFTDITEPAPTGTAMARLQFTKVGSDFQGDFTDIDKVVLARLV